MFSDETRFSVDDEGVFRVEFDPEHADPKSCRRDMEHIPLFLCNILDIPQTGDVEEYVNHVYREFDERIKKPEIIARTHRHKTIVGLYTEKPAWDQR